MKLSNDQVEALVTAVLAVNQYPIEKAWDLLPTLREAGLTDPRTFAHGEIGDVTRRLATAGYDRGRLTSMLASRLQGLMNAVQDGLLDDLPEAAALGDRAAAAVILQRVKGVGPRVADSAWLLLH